jgi:hypothetical protein
MHRGLYGFFCLSFLCRYRPYNKLILLLWRSTKFIILAIWVSYSDVAEDSTDLHISLCQVLNIYALSTGKYLLDFLKIVASSSAEQRGTILVLCFDNTPSLCFKPVCFTPVCFKHFALTMLAKLHHFLISALSLLVNTFWLAAFC